MTKKINTDILAQIPNGGFVPLKKNTKLIKSFNTNIKKNNIMDIFNKKKEEFINTKENLNIIDEL